MLWIDHGVCQIKKQKHCPSIYVIINYVNKSLNVIKLRSEVHAFFVHIEEKTRID